MRSLGAEDSRCWDDAVYSICSMQCIQYPAYAVLGIYSTRCMLYSMYAILSICCTHCSLLIMAWRDREGWLNFVFLGDGRVEDETERDDRRWRNTSWEIGTCENFVCKPIYHHRYGRYEARSGGLAHWYEVFPTQSGKSNPWFLSVLYIILIFISHLSLPRPPLYHHRMTQS